MSSQESWTIGRLLTFTTDYLKQHGSDSPRLDAEVLLAEARGCKRIELYTTFAEIADDQTRTAFRELVRRRAEGTPVAYLVGKREFFSLSFRVTPDVLIPRPETETLVVRLLDLAKGQGGNRGMQISPSPLAGEGRGEGEIKILDVGAGAGIIAISVAKHLPQAKLTAVDSSAAALAIAQQNAADHRVADQIAFLQSDLLSSLPSEQKFNIVASNPPYVSQSEFAKLPPSVKNYEPQQALLAGPRGTELIERLVPQAAQHLRPGGWLLVEVSPMIEPAVRDLINQHGGYQLHPTLRDSADHPRIIQAQYK